MRAKLLALALFAGGIAVLLYWRPSRSEDPRLDAGDDVHLCIERLRRIHGALVAYQDARGSLPEGKGAEVLRALRPGFTDELACPDGTGYAVRDFAAHPLDRFPTDGTEPILACDDLDGVTHHGFVNVLFADRSVQTFELAREVAAGRLPAGTTSLRAGPDSPLPVLRKLRAD